jgi:thioredoxin reductase
MKDALIVGSGLAGVWSAVGTVRPDSTDALLAMAGHPNYSAYAQEIS